MYDRRVMGGRWEEEEDRVEKRGTPYMDDEEEGYQRVVMMKPREDREEKEAPQGRKVERKDNASGSESEVRKTYQVIIYCRNNTIYCVQEQTYHMYRIKIDKNLYLCHGIVLIK